MIGPDYVRPPVPIASEWIETNEPALKREPAEVSTWWTVFHGPVLNTLVETAYRQNSSLRTAGVRVLEAQARRGLAIGQLFPQQQEAFGAYTRNGVWQRSVQNFRSPRMGAGRDELLPSLRSLTVGSYKDSDLRISP